MKTNKQHGPNEACEGNVQRRRKIAASAMASVAEWKSTASAVLTSAGWKGTASAAPTGAGWKGTASAAPTGAGWKGTASAVPTGAGWKGTASAVPTGAQSSLGFSPGLPRLKPRPGAVGFRRAKARRFHPTRSLALAGAMAALLANAGCSRAPSFNILGSFFPAWLLCGVIGITLAVITRFVFLRYDFEKELSPLILVYPALALFYTFTTWLLIFS